MTWGILREYHDNEKHRRIGNYGWIVDSFTGNVKGFPTKTQASDYGKLSFGPFPKRDGALSETRVRDWKVERIPAALLVNKEKEDGNFPQ